MEESFLLFLAISAVVIVTPGQDTALTIRNTLAGGRPGGIATAFGVFSGQAVWALASAIGVVALLAASEPVFAFIKLAGAGYLIFLGLQSLYAAFRSSSLQGDAGCAPKRTELAPRAAFFQGLISNLGNPKMAVFFASLLPQFVPQGAPVFSSLALLGVIFCAMTFIWLVGYTALVSMAGKFLSRPRVRRFLEGLTGAALLALGVRIVTSET